LGGVSSLAGASLGRAVAFGAAAGRLSGLLSRLPDMPVVLSRIPVILPLFPLVMPPELMVALLPLTLGLTVCWLWPVCCAFAAKLNMASRQEGEFLHRILQ
jgi:hypothetical protein